MKFIIANIIVITITSGNLSMHGFLKIIVTIKEIANIILLSSVLPYIFSIRRYIC